MYTPSVLLDNRIDGNRSSVSLVDTEHIDTSHFRFSLFTKQMQWLDAFMNVAHDFCVSAAPQIIQDESFRETVTMKAGTSTTVDIAFTAHPQPEVELQFNGGSVRDSARTKAVVTDNHVSVVLENVERLDTGEYTLTLKNQCGTTTLTLKVIVLG